METVKLVRLWGGWLKGNKIVKVHHSEEVFSKLVITSTSLQSHQRGTQSPPLLAVLKHFFQIQYTLARVCDTQGKKKKEDGGYSRIFTSICKYISTP